MHGHCAILDVGKSNTKASVANSGGKILESLTFPTPHLAAQDIYTAFDVERIFDWFCECLADFSSNYTIEHIIPVTHGATAAMLDEAGKLVMPVQDYEAIIPERYAAAYEEIRPPFRETLSPSLPLGLNLGRQIFWHAKREPRLFKKLRWIVPYPQYWTWLLSGALVSEVTSLGCHTDLWQPSKNLPSSLCISQGWSQLLPKPVSAWEVVGTLKNEIANKTGLSSECVVHAGVHDTNAALFSIMGSCGTKRKTGQPSVLSTGTWFIAMAPGASTKQLSPHQDCLGNVDVFGRPVPCARFMGGRAFDIISMGLTIPPHSLPELMRLVNKGVLALPSFVNAGGPFPGHEGEVVGLPVELDYLRPVLASLYQALMSDVCLDIINARSDIIIEGPVAKNMTFCQALASLRGSSAYIRKEQRGVTLGGAALAFWPEIVPAKPQVDLIEPGKQEREALVRYREQWREAIADRY